MIITIICLSIIVECKKSEYNCQQKITTSMIPDSSGYPQIKYSEFQLKGSISCVVGTTTLEIPINRTRAKVVKYEITSN